MTHVGLITSFCLSAPINNSGHRGHKGQVTDQFTNRQKNREAQEGLVCFLFFVFLLTSTGQEKWNDPLIS